MEFQCYFCKNAFTHASPIPSDDHVPNRFTGFSKLPPNWRFRRPDPIHEPSVWRFACSSCATFDGFDGGIKSLSELADDVHAIRQVIAPAKTSEFERNVTCSKCQRMTQLKYYRNDTRNVIVEIPDGWRGQVDAGGHVITLTFFHEICPE